MTDISYKLCVVPPGGGEADHEVSVRSSSLPRVGEYIIVKGRPSDNDGIACYCARQVNHYLVDMGDNYQEECVVVEAEFTKHPYASTVHNESIKAYETRGKIAKEYPESGY